MLKTSQLVLKQHHKLQTRLHIIIIIKVENFMTLVGYGGRCNEGGGITNFTKQE